jgi:hypothetical protein
MHTTDGMLFGCHPRPVGAPGLSVGVYGQVHAGSQESFGPVLGSMSPGAPIRTGEASPLRSSDQRRGELGLESPRRRSPTCPNKRRGDPLRRRPQKGSEKTANNNPQNLDSKRTLIYDRPAASLRSDKLSDNIGTLSGILRNRCPISSECANHPFAGDFARKLTIRHRQLSQLTSLERLSFSAATK